MTEQLYRKIYQRLQNLQRISQNADIFLEKIQVVIQIKSELETIAETLLQNKPALKEDILSVCSKGITLEQLEERLPPIVAEVQKLALEEFENDETKSICLPFKLWNDRRTN